jgi:hypothetical protein
LAKANGNIYPVQYYPKKTLIFFVVIPHSDSSALKQPIIVQSAGGPCKNPVTKQVNETPEKFAVLVAG